MTDIEAVDGLDANERNRRGQAAFDDLVERRMIAKGWLPPEAQASIEAEAKDRAADRLANFAAHLNMQTFLFVLNGQQKASQICDVVASLFKVQEETIRALSPQPGPWRRVPEGSVVIDKHELEKWLTTIDCHCYVIKSPDKESDIQDCADCIKINTDNIRAMIAREVKP